MLSVSESNQPPVVEEKSGGLIGGTLLIAGTCIGAGMLGMPVATGSAGLIPGLAVNFLCWFYMLLTGLLFLEATLWMHDGANLLSMAQRFLGPIGKLVGGIAFVVLYYCLETAYLAGGTPAFIGLVEAFSGFELSPGVGAALFVGLFGSIVAWGTAVVDRVNWLLMVGLVVSYVLLATLGAAEIEATLLRYRKWAMALPALPVLFAAYGYHNVIPSISTYLARDVRKLRWAIIIGTSVPLVVFSIWQVVVIGTLGPEGIARAAETGLPVTETMRAETSNAWFGAVAMFFGFFALVTSMLGVALSVVDFLGDGLNINNRTGWRRVGLTVLAFLPPLLFAQSYPAIFFDMLGFAGGIGEALLNGFFPVAMVWVGRYVMKLESDFTLPGGKPLLVALVLMTVFVTILEAKHLLG